MAQLDCSGRVPMGIWTALGENSAIWTVKHLALTTSVLAALCSWAEIFLPRVKFGFQMRALALWSVLGNLTTDERLRLAPPTWKLGEMSPCAPIFKVKCC